MKRITFSTLLMVSWLISGCAFLSTSSAKPEVYLTGLRPLSSEGFELRFLVGLKIVNPSHRDLRVSGLSYRLKLNGRPVASGVSGNIGKLPGFGEKRVQVEASTNLLAGFRALTDILKKPGQAYPYELETKLKTPWWPIPITVLESGIVEIGE